MALNIFKITGKNSFAEKSKGMARKGTIGAFLLTTVYAIITSFYTTSGIHILLAFSLPVICVVFFGLTFSKLKNQSIYKLLSIFLIISTWIIVFIGHQIDFNKEYSIVMMTIFILIFQVVPTPKKLITYGSFAFLGLAVALIFSHQTISFIGLILFLFLFSFTLSYIVTLQRRDLIRVVNNNSSILKSLINNTNDAFLLIDYFSKEIKDVNERALEVFKATNYDLLVNEDYKKIFADEDYMNINRSKIKLQISKDGFYDDEILFKTYNGNHFWGHIFLSPFSAAKSNYYLLQVKDIDVKKKFDEKIADTYEKYRFILDELEEFIYLMKYSTDGEANFEYLSPNIEKIFGIKKHEFITPEIQKKVATLYHPDDINNMLAKKKIMLKTKEKMVFNYRIKPIGKEEYISIEETVIPKLNDENNIEALLGILKEKSF